MTARRYIRPGWMQRHVANRLTVRLRPSVIFRLSVAGRRTGRMQTVPVVVLHHDGARYLVSVHGDADWARNLRAAGTAILANKMRTESITAGEVPVAQRGALLDAYAAKFGKTPGVMATFRALPDPADHPVFEIATQPPTRDR